MRYAKRMGWVCYHCPDSRNVTAAGFPDLILKRRDKIIAAELKKTGGRLTKEQKSWLAAFMACGIETHVWYPKDWERIQNTLRRR